MKRMLILLWLPLVFCLLAAAPPSEVQRYIAQTGDDSFATRQAASSRLLSFGYAAYPSIKKAADTHPDPEVKRRCRSVADKLRNEHMHQFGTFPFIDSFWYCVKSRCYQKDLVSFPAELQTELQRTTGVTRTELAIYLARAGGGDCAPWLNYRAATRLWVEDMLDRGVSSQLIQRLLDELTRRDNVYLFGDKKPEILPAPKPDA